MAEKLAAMNQLPEDLEDGVSRDDVFAQVVGLDKPGRVRILGDGVNPSDLWGVVPTRSKQNMMLSKLDITMLESRISMHQSNNLGSNYDSRQHSTSNPMISVPPRPSLRVNYFD